MKQCYHEPVEILRVNGVGYYGADKNGVLSFDGNAVLNLSGHRNIPQLNIPELDAEVEEPYKEIMVAWPDFGVPSVKPTFWLALHKYIRSQGWVNVCAHCVGGHGRTGTALVSLSMVLDGKGLAEAVNMVRSVYCKDAVETPDQIEYLCGLYTELSGVVNIKDIPLSSMEIAARAEQARKAREMASNK